MDRPRLLLDVMLGKLATYLRMCGYDTAYALDRDERDDADEGSRPPNHGDAFQRSPEAEDGALLDLAAEEDRLLITRDVELADRAERSLLLSTLDVTDQLRELADAGFDLSLSVPSRCARCNGTLEPVAETAETPEYAPSASETDVWRCRSCGQRYWRGSHWDDVRETLSEL